jgi:hypothetical protein
MMLCKRLPIALLAMVGLDAAGCDARIEPRSSMKLVADTLNSSIIKDSGEVGLRRATRQMTLDKIDWHSGGDFPEELEEERGGTHIGMYLAWIILNDLHSADLRDEDSAPTLARFYRREITGLDILVDLCDGKFTEDDLTEEGMAFTRHYYQDPPEGLSLYFQDYEVLIGDLPTAYHVENTWKNYDTLAPLISQRFTQWKGVTKRWWKFGR